MPEPLTPRRWAKKPTGVKHQRDRFRNTKETQSIIMPKYERHISSVREEGFEFFLVLQYVACFYKHIMKGQLRHDSPTTLIKWSRDWEYPWVLIKSEIRPTNKVLDCVAGYPPMPFNWSPFGGEVHAIDRDVVICSRLIYALRLLPTIISDLSTLPLIAQKRRKENARNLKRSAR